MEWIHKYEIGKMIDAALSDGNGDHRACISVPDTRRGTFMLYEIISGFYVDYCHRGAYDGLSKTAQKTPSDGVTTFLVKQSGGEECASGYTGLSQRSFTSASASYIFSSASLAFLFPAP